MKVRSKITSKYQITVPREVRDLLKLDAADVIEWEISEGSVTVQAADKPILKFRGILNMGSGDTKEDIRIAWKRRTERYRK